MIICQQQQSLNTATTLSSSTTTTPSSSSRYAMQSLLSKTITSTSINSNKNDIEAPEISTCSSSDDNDSTSTNSSSVGLLSSSCKKIAIDDSSGDEEVSNEKHHNIISSDTMSNPPLQSSSSLSSEQEEVEEEGILILPEVESSCLGDEDYVAIPPGCFSSNELSNGFMLDHKVALLYQRCSIANSKRLQMFNTSVKKNSWREELDEFRLFMLNNYWGGKKICLDR